MTAPVKLRQATLISGRLANEVSYVHRPLQITNSVKGIFYADGLVGKVPTKILLDTGVTVSIAQYEFLPEELHQKLTESTGAWGANGMPLDVVGAAKFAVSLGSFSTEEEFIVIHNLTVDCLLGVDFLKEHGTVMYSKSSILSIGKDSRCRVPMLMGQQRARIDSVAAVIAHVDIKRPGHTIQLIKGELKEECSSFCEALVEQVSSPQPANLSIAR